MPPSYHITRYTRIRVSLNRYLKSDVASVDVVITFQEVFEASESQASL